MFKFFDRLSLTLVAGAVFATIMAAQVGFGWFAADKMTSLATLTEKLYKHPYTVNTSLRDIEISALTINSLVQTASLHSDQDKIAEIAREASAEKALAKRYFAIIKERFLGNPKMVTDAETAYLDLEVTLFGALERVQSGQPQEAKQMLDVDGQEAWLAMKKPLGALRNFADGKGTEFYTNSGQVRDAAFSSFWSSLTLIVGFSGVAAVAMIIMLKTRLSNLGTAMVKIADNKLDTEIPYMGAKTEAGTMAACLGQFLQNAIEKKAMDERQKELESQMAKEKQDMMNKLADDLSASVGSVVQTISAASAQLSATAGAMTNVSDQTQEQVASVNDSSSEATSNVHSVAAATEEMSATFGEINRRITQASDSTRGAVVRVNATTEQIQKLADMSENIGNIVNVISDIAEQTNLLALNATIESARAGEAGRGFAVVASEVKELANQTAKATENINEQIAAIQEMTKEAVESISAISNAVADLQEASTDIASVVEEQDTVTKEIARSIQVAAHGSEQVKEGIELVAQGAVEARASADEVAAASSELSEKSTVLSSSIETFLAKVRAA